MEVYDQMQKMKTKKALHRTTNPLLNDLYELRGFPCFFVT